MKYDEIDASTVKEKILKAIVNELALANELKMIEMTMNGNTLGERVKAIEDAKNDWC